MTNEGLSVASLVLEGRFEDAISRLRLDHPNPMAAMPTVARIEFAELFERTGRLGESQIHLSKAKKSAGLSDSERARCLLLEGLLSKHFGHLEDSLRAFHGAIQFAEKAGSLELRCWAQLRALGLSVDVDGKAIKEDWLLDLRRSVEKAGVSSISIAYHVFLAEYHAKHGQLAASRHHSDLAESLLARYPNLWLRGLLDLQLSCLSYLECSYLESLSAARRAIRASHKSGHVLSGLIALADMAAAYLAIGQSARAESCLSSALRQANSDEQIYGLLLETLAESQLLNGDVAGCSLSLCRAREISARLLQSRSAWHRTWNLRTEARLLQRCGRWQESLELVRSLGMTAANGLRPFTEIQIETLEALALAKLGATQEAREAIHSLYQEALGAPTSSQGSLLSATVALSLAVGGDRRALADCAHALRILGATGETSGLAEVVEQFVQVYGGEEENGRKRETVEVPVPLWRPTSIVCHLEAVSPILLSTGPPWGDLAMFASSLPDLVTEPRELGEETLRLLCSMGWLESGRVVRVEGGNETAVVTYSAQDPKQESSRVPPTRQLSALSVLLGSRQTFRYVMSITPKNSDGAAGHCGGIARLLTALLDSRARPLPDAKSELAMGDEPSLSEDNGVFCSPAMIALVASAKRVAPLHITVLLTGESGTGKEVVARIIHRASGLPHDAFIAFNCATVPRDMLDSQLFGYRRGAFTGAAQSFKGVLSAASGGTLLLDEIGELPLETQPKLLRFLDSGEIHPLGEAVPRKIRVRVLAATNSDLEDLVKKGRFREDLYYRLNVVHFRLPPLRERREEIAPLISKFLAEYACEFGKYSIRLAEKATEHMLLHSWPGNVRQLAHEIRRLVALHESDSVIDATDLDAGIPQPPRSLSQPSLGVVHSVTVRVDRPLSEIVRDVESAAIGDALGATDGRMDLAARRLGISRKGLYLKRQRLHSYKGIR